MHSMKERRRSKAELLACFCLPPSATLAEAREAYLDLVQVWHPDRFDGNPRLKRKAHAATSELNAAWTELKGHYEARAATPARRASDPLSDLEAAWFAGQAVAR